MKLLNLTGRSGFLHGSVLFIMAMAPADALMQHCNYINETGFKDPGKFTDVYAAHPAILIALLAYLLAIYAGWAWLVVGTRTEEVGLPRSLATVTFALGINVAFLLILLFFRNGSLRPKRSSWTRWLAGLSVVTGLAFLILFGLHAKEASEDLVDMPIPVSGVVGVVLIFYALLPITGSILALRDKNNPPAQPITSTIEEFCNMRTFLLASSALAAILNSCLLLLPPGKPNLALGYLVYVDVVALWIFYGLLASKRTVWAAVFTAFAVLLVWERLQSIRSEHKGYELLGTFIFYLICLGIRSILLTRRLSRAQG